ncbi:MAG: FAD-binding protein [Colwelliaceae bacterium]|nr:FAD-binding protein [Colwelliaceae bacterium]
MKKDNDIKAAKEYLVFNNVCYKSDYVLKYDTYFKTGGVAKVFIQPKDEAELENLILFLNSISAEYRVVGFTTNIMFFDEISYSIIISTRNLTKLIVKGNKITVESGYSLQDFVRVCVINEFEGFEGLEGIPGSIGGAVIMNAGAYGDDISDNLLSVKFINKDGKVEVFNKEQCEFCYRESIFRDAENIILSVVFLASKGCKDKIYKKIEMFHIARHSYQEFVLPNLGSMISINKDIYSSVFKNTKYYYLYMIIKVVLKNPLSKFFARKRPRNDASNYLLKKYISSKPGFLTDFQMSKKSANILVNNTQLNSEDVVGYAFMMKSLVEKEFYIENEFIVDALYEIEPRFELAFKKIVGLVNSNKAENIKC